jgi:hypothetical protein
MKRVYPLDNAFSEKELILDILTPAELTTKRFSPPATF